LNKRVKRGCAKNSRRIFVGKETKKSSNKVRAGKRKREGLKVASQLWGPLGGKEEKLQKGPLGTRGNGRGRVKGGGIC